MSDGVGTQGIARPCSLTYVARARMLRCFCRAAGYPGTNHQSDGGGGPRNPDRRSQDKGRDVRGLGRGGAGRHINILARGASHARSLRDAATHSTSTASREVRAGSP
ncbi:hypothetical protein Rmf_43370 [Roseomonas fluvialis]|uniref:Uncharacterized protein n=1 Tax=Roseomonas fluvialis TaxID=1750527 RepID=A0ABM7Y8Z0_9PROT|nr:hypothetical protein Rmf_43370 [Roseomonas fluvialis]